MSAILAFPISRIRLGSFTVADRSDLLTRWPTGTFATDTTDRGAPYETFTVWVEGREMPVVSIWRDVSGRYCASDMRDQAWLDGPTLRDVVGRL